MPSGFSKRTKESRESHSSKSNGDSAWRIEFETDADRALLKLDPVIQRRIALYLEERVLKRDDPRQLGEALRGTGGSKWRYRVGPYRIICEIEDYRHVIVVVKVAHRRTAYP